MEVEEEIRQTTYLPQDGELEAQAGGYIGGGAISNNGTTVSNQVHTNLAGTQETR